MPKVIVIGSGFGGLGAAARIAARGYEVTELGYLGVDMVIDRVHGPLILEMNARPGLAIQIANGTGLTNRIKRIESIYDASAAPAERAPTTSWRRPGGLGVGSPGCPRGRHGSSWFLLEETWHSWFERLRSP